MIKWDTSLKADVRRSFITTSVQLFSTVADQGRNAEIYAASYGCIAADAYERFKL